MNILCIDHVCHRKTRSIDFFLGLLRESGCSVDVFYYERHYSVRLPKEKIRWADVIIYCEFLPSRFNLLFAGKKTVFLPMYDNEWGSFWQWKRIAWSGMGVISFCEKISQHARRCGVRNLLDVRYYPAPQDLPCKQGDPRRVFLWERGTITRQVAEKLFPPEAGYVFDVKGADEFLEKKDYLGRISDCGILIAPRRKEGIGMVFLEAMAMGKCVVAHNDATMNEYIVDGENGILFDADNPVRIPDAKVNAVLDKIKESSLELYLRWKRDSRSVVPFISSFVQTKASFSSRLKTFLAFPLFIAEGILYRMFCR